MNWWASALVYGRMIKFSHSIFALPFAFSGAALAAKETGITSPQIGWIALAMVGARSAAMGFNRLADRHIDGANPRTASRELPSGQVSPLAVGFLVMLSSAVLVFAAWKLNMLCLYLSPLALGVLFVSSLCKRFTWASHLVLGLSLGGAPLGAWVAVTGGFAWPPVLLGLAVLMWVAGFDIVYACQDYEHDVTVGLFSIPARFGIDRAPNIARSLHLLAVAFMILVGDSAALGAIYWLGVAVIAALLLWEHRLVQPDNLTRVNMAFFNLNAIISVLYLVFTLTDLLVLGEPAALWRGH